VDQLSLPVAMQTTHRGLNISDSDWQVFMRMRRQRLTTWRRPRRKRTKCSPSSAASREMLSKAHRSQKFPLHIASAHAEAEGHPRVPLAPADPRPAGGRLRLLSPASPWLLSDSFTDADKWTMRLKKPWSKLCGWPGCLSLEPSSTACCCCAMISCRRRSAGRMVSMPSWTSGRVDMR
jgi:hypothetical protein